MIWGWGWVLKYDARVLVGRKKLPVLCLSLLGLALGSPIFPSGCEGKLGVALESLQALAPSQHP